MFMSMKKMKKINDEWEKWTTEIIDRNDVKWVVHCVGTAIGTLIKQSEKVKKMYPY